MKRVFCISASLVLMIVAGAVPQALSQTNPQIHVVLASPGPVGAATTTAIFSHFAVGGDFATVFTLLNTGSSALTGNLILTNSDGTLTNVSLQSSDGTAATGTSIALNIPQGGTTLVTATPIVAGDPNTKSGWARVESSGGTLGGVSTFKLAPNGILQTIAGVLSSTPGSSATIPVDNDDSQKRYTGYAIANTGSSGVSVKIVVVDTLGNIVNTITPPALNPLPPGQQVARFLHQDLPNLVTFKGSMVLIEQSGANFAIVALIQAQGGSGIFYSAIPVIPGRAANIN